MGNPKSQQEATALALAAGKKFAEMWAAGREPATEEQISRFFGPILEYAHETKDAALFEKALGKLRDAFGKNPRSAGFFKKQDERLEALKAPATPAAPDAENKDTK
jgi:hypothetical protein